MPTYQPTETEAKWQNRWSKAKIHNTDLKKSTKPKYYNLVMFPYPSGDKLHIGHWYNYAPADSWGRYMRMRGYNVFEPMGFDSFGLPAENYAIKTGTPPRQTTEKNVEYMRFQLRAMGTMFDWDKDVVTSHPEYYKWTQWVFLEMYKKGLAYRKKAPVNWCPSCKTVLANEQVEDGKCERCKTEVTKKDLTQWFFNIRSYAEDLLKFDGLIWPEKTKLMQQNWIGRSEGTEVTFEIADEKGQKLNKQVSIFTTRVDTLFSAAFLVLAPEHPLVKEISIKKNLAKIKDYQEKARKTTDIERTAEDREKTGVPTGCFVINPINGDLIPVWIGDFVLMHYGTGAVFGDAHDARDFKFAKKYKVPLKTTIKPADGRDDSKIRALEECFTGDGILYNSAEFDGLTSAEARKKITEKLITLKAGRFVINYKLRDWLISRQRYWGAPIPMIICEKCGDVPVPLKDLPVLLPEKNVDYKPRGKSPLASVASFVKTKCPKCGSKAQREVDTMDTFVDSSWYFLRYPSGNRSKKPFEENMVKKWLPVDMYIGGPEHACMHLLYARFVHKALVGNRTSEPFKRLVHQGLITKDGAKMSKSKGNVVSPDQFVQKYGSDVFRMYLMFMGPFTDGGDWSDKGITGIARFVEKFYAMMTAPNPTEALSKEEQETLERNVHKTIKKVSEDIEKFHFNTTISALMQFTNNVGKIGIDKENKKKITMLIAPLAPHLAEEIWEQINMSSSAKKPSAKGKKFSSIFDQKWPEYNPELIVENMLTLPIQVNGKLRGQIQVPAISTKENILEEARKADNVAKYLEGQKILKEIYVPGRLINFVVQG